MVTAKFSEILFAVNMNGILERHCGAGRKIM